MIRLITRRASAPRRAGPEGHGATAPAAAAGPPAPAEVRAIPAHIVLAALVRRQLLPAILEVSSASQLPQTQVPVAALQEQEKIASLTLDLLYSLGFDEEDCLNALRGMIRAIDGHGRAESQTAQDNGKAAPATPGTPTDGGHEEPAFTPARNDGGHVGTPPVIPTPTALFPGSPTVVLDRA
jgi:hypothetical protein